MSSASGKGRTSPPRGLEMAVVTLSVGYRSYQLYAPNRDTFFRFGVSPSGASWSPQSANREVALNLDGWDVGVGVEHRLWRSLWGSLRE